MTNTPFVNAANVVIFLCALFGLFANMTAFRRFAVASVRPLLGWTIIAQFFLCLTLAIEEARDLLFHVALRNPTRGIDFSEMYAWQAAAVLTKVTLGASVIFSATMVVGLLWRAEETAIRRAAACSVVWTFVVWLALALSVRWL